MMQTMMTKSGPMVVVTTLGALLIGSVIAVFMALALFLVRRSRVIPVATAAPSK
jgi:hypothetical protein